MDILNLFLLLITWVIYIRIQQGQERAQKILELVLCTFPRWAWSNCEMEAGDCSKAVGG